MSLASLFLVIGAADLSLVLLKLAVPGLFDATALISYGHLRPAAFSLIVLGFGGTLAQAAAYYLTPRLIGAPLRSERFATLNGYIYAALVAAGSLWVLMSGPAGGELSEFPTPLAIALGASMLIPAFIVTRTLRHRTEGGSFVTLLYVLGAVWWYPALYIVGIVDVGGGVARLLQTSVVGGGLLTLAFPAAGLGASFYVVAKETGRPLFSGSLARASFWTLAGTTIVAAPVRYMAGPSPAWLESIGTVMSLGLAVSALAVLANLMLTMAGDWETISNTPALKLTLAGAAAYAVISVLAGIQGFRAVGAVVGLTTWNDGLSIGLMLVAVPLMSMGFIFHAFPRAARRQIFGPDTVSRGVRLTLWGGGATSMLLIVAGIVSGLSWNAGAASGAFANSGLGFQQSLGSVSAMYTVAAITSTIAVFGLVPLAWTFIRTFTSGAVAPAEVLMVGGDDE
jgi:cytochrome c oxidase cbb3-type subunit 1